MQAVERRGVFVRALEVDYAFHSPQMDPFRGELTAALSALAPRDAAVTFASTVTGPLLAGHALDAEYWARNMREPVRFVAAIEALARDGRA